MNAILYVGRVTETEAQTEVGTAYEVIVTKENNGYAVWKSLYQAGTKMVKFIEGEGAYSRTEAIEYGVLLAVELRKA